MYPSMDIVTCYNLYLHMLSSLTFGKEALYADDQEFSLYNALNPAQNILQA